MTTLSTSATPTSMPSEQRYPIKVVVHRTGLTPHTIRVWERRYGAVTPPRTATNRRLYSDADIERLICLRHLTLAGHTISHIAQLPMAELRRMVAVEDAASAAVPFLTRRTQAPASGTALIEACLDAVRRFDTDALETALAQASVLFSQPLLIEQIIVPLMWQIGARWHNGELRIVHEHLASEVVRHFLWNMCSGVESPATAPHLIVTTPAGQLHEIGALLVAGMARADGWRATYLGPNLPAEEIAVAVQTGVKAVALSLVYPPDDLHLGLELTKLRRRLAPEVSILVGGQAAEAYGEVLEAIGALRVRSMTDLRTHLQFLRSWAFSG